MAMFERCSVGRLFLNNTSVQIISGKATTRAMVLAETEDGMNNPAIGSVYLSSVNGHQYNRKAAAGVAADWEVVTTTAAD